MADVHARLTAIVDDVLGVRPNRSIEQLLDDLEKELPALLTQIRRDALLEAIEQCERERRACEKLTKHFPRNAVHATGVLIADVCARRVRTLQDETDERSGTRRRTRRVSCGRRGRRKGNGEERDTKR